MSFVVANIITARDLYNYLISGHVELIEVYANDPENHINKKK